jgi:hypothetical protein
MTADSPSPMPISGSARYDPYPKNLLEYSFLNKNSGSTP